MGAEIEANDSSALAEIDFDDGMFCLSRFESILLTA